MSKSTMPTIGGGGEAKRLRTDDSTEGKDSVEYCFVCDDLITDKKYPIANCLTNTTKSRLIEVLGRLVSEKYVVVVSNVDKICRSCANLLNTLDKLEYETMNTKQTLLSSIERKYGLHDDDLYKKATPKKVVLGNAQNFKNSMDQKTPQEKGPAFKGSAVMPVVASNTSQITKTGPPNVWMQCNKCQYTTNQRPVMLDHLREHKAKETEEEKTVIVQDKEASGMDASALAAVTELQSVPVNVSTMGSSIIASSSNSTLNLS